jgi:hypothetical protein
MASATPTAPIPDGRASEPETMGVWAYPIMLSGRHGDPRPQKLLALARVDGKSFIRERRG